VEQCTTYARLVADLPDPRHRRGCRFAWSILLWLIGAALVSGQLTPSAISQWIKEHAEPLGDVVGVRLPSDATIRRTLQRVDIVALEACFRQPLPAHSAESREARALDGKAVRGTGTHGHPLHLVSEVCHDSGQVIQQQAVEHKSNEIPLVQLLLRGRDLRGLVFTLDALHTQRRTAQAIVGQGGQYLMVVKANQPELYQALSEWFAQPAWFGEQEEQVTTFSTGHGRHEWRTLARRAVVDLPWDWPGVQQVMRRHTVADLVSTGQRREHVCYALTSLSWQQASAADLERLWRGHWHIENKVHYVRDVTWREDASQCWVGNAAHALATLHNGLTNLLRQAGWSNIAAALRHFGADCRRALRFIGVLC
jgi:predicted transposase YbfD/YdcC